MQATYINERFKNTLTEMGILEIEMEKREVYSLKKKNTLEKSTTQLTSYILISATSSPAILHYTTHTHTHIAGINGYRVSPDLDNRFSLFSYLTNVIYQWIK